jgi:tetratricopeptide (TPR) repeat protein
MKFSRLTAMALAIGAGSLMSSAALADVSAMGGAPHDCYVEARAGTDLVGGIQACTEALDVDMSASDRASTLVNRAVLRSMSHDFEGALADYTAALQIGERVADIYTDRSAVYLSLARYAEAKADADKALSLHATRPEIAYFNRAVADETLGNIKGAYEDYKAALAANPNFKLAADSLTRFKVIKSSGS